LFSSSGLNTFKGIPRSKCEKESVTIKSQHCGDTLKNYNGFLIRYIGCAIPIAMPFIRRHIIWGSILHHERIVFY
jgi:hypothetical protein